MVWGDVASCETTKPSVVSISANGRSPVWQGVEFPILSAGKRLILVLGIECTIAITELAQKDWVPFRQVRQNTNAFVMLGYVILPALDPEYSFICKTAALNDGVDLILTVFDSEVYYTAMDTLLQSDQRQELNGQALPASPQRLVSAYQLLKH